MHLISILGSPTNIQLIGNKNQQELEYKNLSKLHLVKKTVSKKKQIWRLFETSSWILMGEEDDDKKMTWCM